MLLERPVAVNNICIYIYSCCWRVVNLILLSSEFSRSVNKRQIFSSWCCSKNVKRPGRREMASFSSSSSATLAANKATSDLLRVPNTMEYYEHRHMRFPSGNIRSSIKPFFFFFFCLIVVPWGLILTLLQSSVSWMDHTSLCFFIHKFSHIFMKKLINYPFSNHLWPVLDRHDQFSSASDSEKHTEIDPIWPVQIDQCIYI